MDNPTHKDMAPETQELIRRRKKYFAGKPFKRGENRLHRRF